MPTKEHSVHRKMVGTEKLCPPYPAIAYRALGKKSGQVFPVKYRSLIPITRGKISGTINAFLRKKSFNVETIIEYKMKRI